MMKDRVFGHGTTTSMVGSPESSKVAKLKEQKAKEKVKGKGGFKRTGEVHLAKNKHRTLNGGQKKIVFGGPRIRKARKLLRKVRTTFLKVNSVPIIQKRVQIVNNTTRTKEEAKIRKEKARKVPILNHGLSASETPSEEGYCHFLESDNWYSCLTDDSSSSAIKGTTAWYGARHTACMSSILLDLANHPTHVVLDLGCTRSVGSRAAIRKVPETCVVLWHYDRVLPL